MSVFRIVLGSVLLLSPAFAQVEVDNLEENLPTGLSDARPTSGLSLQGVSAYRHDSQKRNLFDFAPQIQYGWSKWYAQVTYLLEAGPGDRRNSGDVRFQLFRQLNDEKGPLPTFAVFATADAPTGIKSAGLDTRLQGNASKTLGSSPAGHRIHLNLGWFHNAGRREDERSNAYRVAAGYSQTLGQNVLVIADYFRQESRERGQTLSLLELGFRIRLGKNTLLAIGGGAGIRSRPAKSAIFLGLEESF